MASKSLTFDIFGRDKTASKTIKGVGDAADGMGSKLGKLAGVIGLAFSAAAITDFATDSVKAAAEAESAQAKLADAFARFPALADTNADRLGKLNSALALKTRYDDDATTSGQAVLASFGLTGAQLEKMTPLLQDFAAKTGKDLPTAAEDLGKALLGQGRGLKEIGINFKDTGSLGGNFEAIMGSVGEKVGGFAATDGATAAGGLEILKNKFGEVQEKIGTALIPMLTNLSDFTSTVLLPAMDSFGSWMTDTGGPALQAFGTWVGQNKDMLIGLGIALAAGVVTFGLLTGAMAIYNAVVGIQTAITTAGSVAQWAMNAAMTANPIGIVIVLIAALVAGLVWVATQTTFFQDTWTAMTQGIGAAMNWVWNSVIKPVCDWIAVAFKLMGAATEKVFSGIGNVIGGAFNGVVGIVRGVVNTVIGMVNNVIGNINGIGSAVSAATGGAIDVHIGKIPMLATGGTIANSGWAVVGEKGPELVNLPTGASVYPNGTGPRGAGGGDTFNIYEASSARSTALAVSRRQNDLAAV